MTGRVFTPEREDARMGEVIDQDGQRQVYKAHFWRHYVECCEEFDTPEEAIAFLNYGEEYGDLSSRGVVWPDGTEREYDWVNDADGSIMLNRKQADAGPRQIKAPDA